MKSTDAATTLRLNVLGHVEIEGPAGAEKLHAQPTLLLLLAYLALSPARAFVSRDRLVAAFWPDQSEERGRSSLRSALYALRTILGADLVQRRGEDVALDAALLECDARGFSEAIRRDELARALELYRGPLLDGVNPHSAELQHWLDAERGKLRASAADAAWQLAERYESRATDLTSATRWARKAAQLAGTDERRIRKVMTLLDRAGDAAGAVGVYEEFARFLSRELQMAPSNETAALALTLRERRA